MITKRRQRRIVLTAALTGPSYSASCYPKIPLAPQEVVLDAQRSFQAGARALHVHARNPRTGLQFADANYYREIRAGCDLLLSGVPISYGSSRKGEVELQIDKERERLHVIGYGQKSPIENIVRAELLRAIGVEAKPDRITTFTPPELLIAGHVAQKDYDLAVRSYSDLTRNSWKDPVAMREYYRRLTSRARALGVAEELEITTWRAFEVVEQIALDPTLTLPTEVSFVLLFGFSAHLPIERSAYCAALERVENIGRRAKAITHVTVGAAIPPTCAHRGSERAPGEPLPPGKHDYREIIEWVADDDRVESFRVGLEDTPELFGKKLGNSDLVAHAREIFESLDVPIELDVREVRRTFGLPICRSQLLAA